MIQVASDQMLKIKRVLPADQCSGTRFRSGDISTCYRSLFSVLVIQLEHIPQLGIIVRIAETAERIAVKKHAVIFVGNDERNGNLRVVLEEFFILSLVIELIRLVLSQSVESLIVR